MVVSEFLGGFYGKIEDAFYGLTDFLDNKGIPVYTIIDPLEERGIPAFPLTIAVLVLIGFFVFAFLSFGSEEISVELDIINPDGGEQLFGVQLEAISASGKRIDLDGTLFSHGQKVLLKGMPVGETITFKARKNGYSSNDFDLKLTGTNDKVILRMQEEIKIITGQIKLVDPTGDNITDAQVVAKFRDDSDTFCSGLGNGVFECNGIKEGELVQLSVTSSNYEDFQVSTEFFEDSEKPFTLVPKASAEVGETNLIIRVVEEQTTKPIKNANIKIFDASDDGLITEVTDEDGEFLAKINKGTSIRLSVSAESFVRYDSSAEGVERTLRADEELWTVPMKPGGVTLTVRAKDESGLPSMGVEIQLFNDFGKILDFKQTSFGGEVFFDDLNAEHSFFVTAYKQGFLPIRKQITPLNSNEVSLELQRATESNSANLKVYVLHSDGLAANDATLNFFELVGEEELPLGLPAQKSDVTGKYSVLVPLEKKIIGRAVKGKEKGEDSIEIIRGITNELFIELEKSANFLDLKLVNLQGSAITSGTLRIESSQGELLFEADLEKTSQEELFFEPFENDFVELTYVSLENESFTSQVYVKGQNEVTITIGEISPLEFTPKIEFKGVFDVSGKKVEGINKGKDYYLHFEAVFPEGNGEHGLHVRVGPDTIKYADSQDVGIVGFSAVGGKVFYGRTYSPFPAPGLSGIDYSNFGKAGNYNKWIELTFNEAGTKIVKVRVKAKETSTDSSFDVHYRAWSEFGSAFNRDPIDNVLENDSFNSQKSGLYALTHKQNTRILKATSNCKEEICVSYRFLNKDNSQVDVEKFKPIINELYAIEVSINPLTDLDATIKATTSKSDPKLFFQGYAVDGAAIFPDNNKTDTSIEVSGLISPAQRPIKVLLFFKTVDIQTTSITVQTINAETVINDNFFFEIFKEKKLVASTNPEEVKFGTDFSFTIEDEEGEPVENAQIVLKNSLNEHLETIVGIGLTDKGKNGKYKVFNTFNTGILKYSIGAEQFRPLEGELEISREDVLRFLQSAEIKIIRGQTESQTEIELENISSDIAESISFEIKKIGNFPKEMSLQAEPIQFVSPKTIEKIKIKASYAGGSETAHGEAILVVRGRVTGQYNVRAETKVIIDYNPTIEQNCLEFSKAGLVVFLESGSDKSAFYNDQYDQSYYNNSLPGYNGNPGYYGNSYYNEFGGGYDFSGVNSRLGLIGNTGQYNPSEYYNDYDYSNFGLDPTTASYANEYSNPLNRFYGYNNSKQVEFVIRNKCDFELELLPEVVGRDSAFNDGINVQVNTVKLQPAGTNQSGKRLDEQRVTVNVTNTMLRNYPSLSSLNFDIFFNSPAISKSLPLNIVMWDPVYGLEVGRNIELWLAQESASQPAIAQSPIFVRNVGQAPIENLAFRQSSSGYSRGNVTLQIEPTLPVRLLAVGQSLFPPKTVVAKATRTEKTTPLDMKIISVRGIVDGKLQDFGPIYVTTHVSGFECLSVTPNSVEFVSKKTTGVLSKKLNIKNTCTEEVRITQVTPNQFGSNTLSMSVGNLLIPPGSQSEVELILHKNEEWEQQTVVSLDAFLVRSARFTQTNPINVDIRIGEEAVSTKRGFEEKNILICQSEETKPVKFPKIATTPDCENAYCDAELFGEFLILKANEKLKEAKRRISHYKSETTNTGCPDEQISNGYCDFEGLQTQTETFSVFFQNDQLTPQLLKKIAEKKGEQLGKFKVDYIVGKNVGAALGQIGNKILLNGKISGCGRYSVSIKGAVKVSRTRFDPEIINILIDLFPHEEQEQEREITEQCLPRIQNVMNFLPQNKSFKDNFESGQTWSGFVSTKENGLQNLGKEIAKGLFTHPTRFIGQTETSNFLDLEFGNFSDYVAKIEMKKEETSGPRKFIAQIQETVFNEQANAKGIEQTKKLELQRAPEEERIETEPGIGEEAPKPLETNEAPPETSESPPERSELPEPPPVPPKPSAVLKTQIEKEAAKAIIGLRRNAIDGCISENEEFILLKSAAEISGIEIELGSCTDQISGNENVITLVPNTQSCCEVVVSSPISETVVPNFIATDIPGIENTNILLKETVVSSQEIELNQKDSRTNKYYSKLLLCSTGNEQDFAQANGKIITLEAKSSKNSERKATSKRVKLSICGIHPNRLVDKINEIKEPGTYYATLVWKGGPESIHFSDATNLALARSMLAEAKAIDVGKVLSGQAEIESQKRSKRLSGLGIYLGACGATSVISSWKFGFGWFTDGVFNCLIPALIAGSDLFDSTKAIKEFVVDTVKDIPVLSNFADFIGEQAIKVAGWLEQDPEKLDQTELDQLAIGALTSVPTYTAARVIGGSIQQISSLNNGMVAAQLSSRISKTIVNEEFRKLFLTPGPRAITRILPGKTNALRTAIEKAYNTEIINALNEFSGQGLKYSDPISGASDGKTILQHAMERAHVNVAQNQEVLEAFGELKGDFVKQSTKNAFNETYDGINKGIQNIDDLATKASGSAESVLIENTATGKMSLANLNRQRRALADSFISENSGSYRQYLDDAFGKEFLDESVAKKMETQWKKGVRNYIQHVEPTKKVIDLPTGGQRLEVALDFSGAKAKKAMQAGVNQVKSKFKLNIDAIVTKKASQQIFVPAANSADQFITKQGGKYKLKYSNFKALITSPATLTFWKNMAKGIFTGAIANAAGLWAYKQFMDKYGAIEGAQQRIRNVDEEYVDTDADGENDTVVKTELIDRELVKYFTYPVEVKFDEDDLKDVAIRGAVEPSSIKKGSKRIQECNDSLLEKYTEIPNLIPKARVFKEKNLGAANIKAVINYYEKYGALLKKIDIAGTYKIPEALVITVGVWNTGLGEETNEWIAGCKQDDPDFKQPSKNFRCAAKELKQYLTDPKSPCDAKCALQKYSENPQNKQYSKQVDLVELEKIYDTWNSPEFKRTSDFSFG